MLVLSRHEGGELVIGNDVRIVVLRLSPTRVSLGIEAPKSVPIMRTEIVGRDEPLEPRTKTGTVH